MKHLIFALNIICAGSWVQAAETFELPARYTVPVENTDLEPYAVFNLNEYTVVSDGENSEVNYRLPLELTGGEQIQIRLHQVRESNGQRLLAGELGIAECEGPWKAMKCQTRFFISPDPAKIKAYIESNIPANQQAHLLQVALRFSGEPIGISETQP